MLCKENPELELSDGATRVFLNSHERRKEMVSEDLEVKYMQTWEEKAMEREEGRRVGNEETRREIIEKMSERLSVKEIAQLLGMEEDAVKNTLKKSKPE